MVFLDETGTDMRDSLRRYGYSVRGKQLCHTNTTGFLTNEILMKNSNFMGSPYENVMKWTHDIFIAM